VRLSPHFRSEEFDSHDGARMPLRYRWKLRRLCRRYLEPLRSRFGPVTVTSGYRSLSHNARVGGAPRSFHTFVAGRAGAAADVVCARGRPGEWHAYLDSIGAPGLGLYPSFVHVDTRRGRARW
jgi:uncharacterized protein YcbK (DUF882 family)